MSSVSYTFSLSSIHFICSRSFLLQIDITIISRPLWIQLSLLEELHHRQTFYRFRRYFFKLLRGAHLFRRRTAECQLKHVVWSHQYNASSWLWYVPWIWLWAEKIEYIFVFIRVYATSGWKIYAVAITWLFILREAYLSIFITEPKSFWINSVFRI